MRRFAISIVAAIGPIPASAHPGHSESGAVGIVHYATDPFHIAMGLVAISAGVLGLAVWRIRRRGSIVAR